MAINRIPVNLAEFSLVQVLTSAPVFQYDDDGNVTETQDSDADGRPLYKVDLLVQFQNAYGLQNEIIKVKTVDVSGKDPQALAGKSVQFKHLTAGFFTNPRTGVTAFTFAAESVSSSASAPAPALSKV